MLERLKQILEKEKLTDRTKDFEERYTSAIRNNKIRDIFDLETPKISNLTDMLEIENKGSLYVVRMDLGKGADNHKKPVVAGLILRRVLQGRLPKKGIDTLIDGGNYNSAKVLKHYTRKFGMKGMYIMSRLFLQKPEILEELSSYDFQIEIAPEVKGKPIEREFYDYLFQRMRNRDFSRNKDCLWHAKYSGKAMYPFGIEIAEVLKEKPDLIISCLGAGSTLEGFQLAIQDYYAEKKLHPPSIVVGEHELSPLFSKFIKTNPSLGSPKCVRTIRESIDPNYYSKINGLPHLIIGPHYDEINPLLSKDAISRIDLVAQYSDKDCIAIQKYLMDKGISVGNSSAANLNVAANLANQGKKVLTLIFEPFRDFYKK